MTRALCHFDNTYWLPRCAHAWLYGQDQHPEQYGFPWLWRTSGRAIAIENILDTVARSLGAIRLMCGASTSTARAKAQHHAYEQVVGPTT